LPKGFGPPFKADQMDYNYYVFAKKCLFLQDHVFIHYDCFLSPRQLDNLLVDLANERLIGNLAKVKLT